MNIPEIPPLPPRLDTPPETREERNAKVPIPDRVRILHGAAESHLARLNSILHAMKELEEGELSDLNPIEALELAIEWHEGFTRLLNEWKEETE